MLSSRMFSRSALWALLLLPWMGCDSSTAVEGPKSDLMTCLVEPWTYVWVESLEIPATVTRDGVIRGVVRNPGICGKPTAGVGLHEDSLFLAVNYQSLVDSASLATCPAGSLDSFSTWIGTFADSASPPQWLVWYEDTGDMWGVPRKQRLTWARQDRPAIGN